MVSMQGVRNKVLKKQERQFILGFFLKIYLLFIYLFYLFLAVSGLSCGTWDLSCGTWDLSSWRVGSSLQHAGFSLVVACEFSHSSCGTRAPEHVGSVVCSAQAL